MRVSINERQEVSGVTAQTKYFLQGTVEECRHILELLEDQAIDKEERDALPGRVIDLEAERVGERPASGMVEGDDRVVELPAPPVDVRRLIRAVSAIYYAAWWLPDRPCEGQDLWTELRDAAGFNPGIATAALGLNRHHMTGVPKIAGEPPLFFELRDFFGTFLGTDAQTVVDKATAHLTAKMFMARWRSRCGISPLGGDEYYLDCVKNRESPVAQRDPPERRAFPRAG